MNTAVVRAGIVNVPVLLWSFAVLTTGSCVNACTGCSTSGRSRLRSTRAFSQSMRGSGEPLATQANTTNQ